MGHELPENQQILIQVGNLPSSHGAASGLPEWCNVFAGLSDEEIAEIEKAALQRTEFSRPRA